MNPNSYKKRNLIDSNLTKVCYASKHDYRADKDTVTKLESFFTCSYFANFTTNGVITAFYFLTKRVKGYTTKQNKNC